MARFKKFRYFRHRVDAEAISVNGDEHAVFVGQQQKSPYKHVCANSGCRLGPGPIVQDSLMEVFYVDNMDQFVMRSIRGTQVKEAGERGRDQSKGLAQSKIMCLVLMHPFT